MKNVTKITEAQVEAAAKALYANKTGSAKGFGHTLFRRTWLQTARIALEAAQAAAPVVDVEKLAEVIAKVLEGQEAMHCTRVWEAWGYGTMREDDFSLVSEDAEAVTEIAQAVADYLNGGAK